MSGYAVLKPGLNNTSNYVVSGFPFVTASVTAPANNSTAKEIVFPSVTKAIHIHNNDSSNGLRIGFSANGVSGSNYWLVEPHLSSGKSNDYIKLEVKTDRIFIMSNAATACSGAYVAAELTGITGYNLCADVYTGSVGVG